MLINDLFTFLYPVVPMVGMAGYVPQIVALIRAKRIPQSISLSTWFAWTMTWLVSLGYGVFELQDSLFCMTASMNLMGHLAIIGLTLFKKCQYAEDRGHEQPLTPIMPPVSAS